MHVTVLNDEVVFHRELVLYLVDTERDNHTPNLSLMPSFEFLLRIHLARTSRLHSFRILRLIGLEVQLHR